MPLPKTSAPRHNYSDSRAKIITGVFRYGNGLVLRAGTKTKIWVPQTFFPELENPLKLLANKVIASGHEDKYYGGKFKNLIVVRDPENIRFVEADQEDKKDENNLEKKIKKIFFAIGKKNLYEKLKKKNKLELVYKSPFFLTKKEEIDFLTALSIYYLVQGKNAKLPLLGCDSALSWVFWEFYLEKRTSEVTVFEAYNFLKNTLLIDLPSLEKILKYCFQKKLVCFYKKDEKGSLKEIFSEKELLSLQPEEIFFTDWKFKTVKKNVDHFLDSAFSNEKKAEPPSEDDPDFYQKTADFILQNKITVITGEAGSGKSTLIMKLCEILENRNIKTLKTAPTGSVAVKINGVTVAKAFDTFEHLSKGQTPIAFDAHVIFIDESSQLDTLSLFQIFKKLRPDQKLVFAGDPKQFPPVRGEERFEEIVKKAKASGKLITLKTTHRFSSERKAVIYQFETPQDLVAGLASIYCSLVLKKKFFSKQKLEDHQAFADSEIIIATPYHRNFLGTRRINLLLKLLEEVKIFTVEKILNIISKTNRTPGHAILERVKIEPGTKVLVTKNIYNGNERIVCSKDVGRVVEVENESKTAFVQIRRNNSLVRLPLDCLYPAYALEFFSSQGLEANYCIVILPENYIKTLDSTYAHKALLVATSRAKKTTIILITKETDIKSLLSILRIKFNLFVHKAKTVTKEDIVKKLYEIEKEIKSYSRYVPKRPTVNHSTL